MRHHTARLPLVASATLLLSLVSAVAVGAQTAGDTEDGTLSAVVASTAGRTITSVVSPTATVVDGVTTISAGTPATVVVEEVGAKGAAWYVTLGLTSDLKDGTTTVLTKDKVSLTSSTQAVVVLPDPVTNSTIQPVVTSQTTSAALGTPATLFSVANQSTTHDYTATYTSTVPFTVDASTYTGAIAEASANFTVTVYQ